MTANEKLEALRKSMRANGIHAYIIPSADPHLDEYVPEHYKARAWISGFTGSAGTVAVTFDKAVLWTDGRYYIQAAKQTAPPMSSGLWCWGRSPIWHPNGKYRSGSKGQTG